MTLTARHWCQSLALDHERVYLGHLVEPLFGPAVGTNSLDNFFAKLRYDVWTMRQIENGVQERHTGSMDCSDVQMEHAEHQTFWIPFFLVRYGIDDPLQRILWFDSVPFADLAGLLVLVLFLQAVLNIWDEMLPGDLLASVDVRGQPCHQTLHDIRVRPDTISAAEQVSSVADRHVEIFFVSAQRLTDQHTVGRPSRDAMRCMSCNDCFHFLCPSVSLPRRLSGFTHLRGFQSLLRMLAASRPLYPRLEIPGSG